MHIYTKYPNIAWLFWQKYILKVKVFFISVKSDKIPLVIVQNNFLKFGLIALQLYNTVDSGKNVFFNLSYNVIKQLQRVVH